MNQSTILASNTSFLKTVCFAVLLVTSSLRAGEADTPAKDTHVGRRKIIWSDPIEVYKKPALEVFGERELPVVNSGFLFVDGEYIHVPYRISQVGNCVYVNGRRILKCIWPPTFFCLHREKPQILATVISKARRLGDLKMDKAEIRYYSFDEEYYVPSTYDDLLSAWCFFFYLPMAANHIYAQEIRKLPFVQRVDILAPPAVGVHVRYKDGFSMTYQNPGPDNNPERKIYGSDAIIKRMNKTMNHLIVELKAGNIVFWESRDKSIVDANQNIWHLGGRVGGIRCGKIPIMMPTVLRIVKSKEPLEKKASKLAYELGVFKRTSNARRFCSSFRIDDEFRHRMQELTKEIAKTKDGK